MKRYVLFIIVSSSFLCYGMEENSFETIKKKQDHYNAADECAEEIRNRIDKEILGIDENRWFRSVLGTWYSLNKFSALTTSQEKAQLLDTIEKYIPSQQEFDLVVKALIERHSLVARLMNGLISEENKQLCNVNGATIDGLFNENRTFYNLSPLMSSFIKKQALAQYKAHNLLTDFLPIIPFDKDDEVHYIPLSGHKQPINLELDKLLMSSESKYLRAIDPTGDVIVWDMESGKAVENINITNMIWTRYAEDNHHCTRQRVIDKNDKYLATPGMALAFGSEGIHKIQNLYSDYSFPIILLFIRPTIESYLCQIAFNNSKKDKDMLTALQDSETLKKVKGFPATNLQRLIEQELLKIPSKL